MATFKICVRNRRPDGFWPVYIRITNYYTVGYIRTDWVVDDAGLAKDGTVKDVFIMTSCMNQVAEYVKRLNGVDTIGWSMKRLKSFLDERTGEYSFTRFAENYIRKMQTSGRENNANVYKSSLLSLSRYLNKDEIAFSDLSRETLERWIASLSHTRRARTLYPTCMRVVFNDAVLASQEPSSPIGLIRYNPWGHIVIPTSDVPPKRAISADLCRRFFGFEINRRHADRARLGRDVALLSFSLAAINTVDLYKLRKDDLRDGVICYHRSKTAGRRKDGAYFEIKVSDIAAPLLEKYKASEESEYLLSFAEKYPSARIFNITVNEGIKQVCEWMGMKAGDYLSFYTFRHTWATIARNDCGASLSEVGFAMNHLQSDGVTRGYIKPDFSPAWRLNEKVLAFVFPSDETEEGSEERKYERPAGLEVSPKDMIYARAYFRGEVLAEVGDVGFADIDAVIDRLASRLPAVVSDGAAVLFRIKNIDSGLEKVYELIKGKSF